MKRKIILILLAISTMLTAPIVAYAQQCLVDYETTGSLTRSQFNRLYGQDAGIEFYFQTGAPRLTVCFDGENIGSGNCEMVGGFLQGSGNGVRITWDPVSETAFFAYQAKKKQLRVGWAKTNRETSMAREIISNARTSETPQISIHPNINSTSIPFNPTNPQNQVLLVTYKGRTSDNLFYAYRRNPTSSSSRWNGNNRAGGGQTRFGPDRLCARQFSDQFILQYRGRSNTRRCYQTIYDISSNSWGRETRCSTL